MARRIWEVVIDGKTHEVMAHWNSWVASGELLVNGKVIDAWGPSLSGGGVRRFQLAGKDAILQSTAFAYRLFVEGRKMKGGLASENLIAD